MQNKTNTKKKDITQTYQTFLKHTQHAAKTIQPCTNVVHMYCKVKTRID